MKMMVIELNKAKMDTTFTDEEDGYTVPVVTNFEEINQNKPLI